LVEPTAANARRLAAAFREFGYDELADQTPAHFAVEERMATLGRPPVAIDVLSSTKGLSFAEAWNGRTILRIDGGARIGFLGLTEYVKTKRACGRPKDLLDIELLREAGLLDALNDVANEPKAVRKRAAKTNPAGAVTKQRGAAKKKALDAPRASAKRKRP
jgi:hypothetical protein